MLEDANIDYEKIDADEAPELVAEFGIRQAPTLVVVKDGQAEVYANASSIIGYIGEI
jgi:ribonucleoside-triphosphate reductase